MMRLAKVFADELRIKIVAELNTREMSPKELPPPNLAVVRISRVSRRSTC